MLSTRSIIFYRQTLNFNNTRKLYYDLHKKPMQSWRTFRIPYLSNSPNCPTSVWCRRSKGRVSVPISWHTCAYSWYVLIRIGETRSARGYGMGVISIGRVCDRLPTPDAWKPPRVPRERVLSFSRFLSSKKFSDILGRARTCDTARLYEW